MTTNAANHISAASDTPVVAAQVPVSIPATATMVTLEHSEISRSAMEDSTTADLSVHWSEPAQQSVDVNVISDASGSNALPTITGEVGMSNFARARHKKKRKWPKEKHHHCPHCPYESNRAERLKVHIQGVHNNERAFACSLCDRRFKQKDKLTRHVSSVHLQEKPFSCDFCAMSFARKDEVSRHTSIVHFGEKSGQRSKNTIVQSIPVMDKILIECPECSYTCQSEDKLKLHLTSAHEDVRRHSCNFCEKRFKLKDKLNLHVNTVHLRKKPFQCQFCNQAFGRKDAAKRHEVKWCPFGPRYEESKSNCDNSSSRFDEENDATESHNVKSDTVVVENVKAESIFEVEVVK